MNAHRLPGRAVLAVIVTVGGTLLTGQMAFAASTKDTWDSDTKTLVYVMQANAGGYANLIVYEDWPPGRATRVGVDAIPRACISAWQ